MAKIIMHIDLNAFFATAETIRDPSLEGKPLIIAGSSRRGIVSTASYEARKFGIHSAMPTYMAQRLCPNVIIRNVDFELYHRLSNEFFDFVRQYTPIIEIASVDECYADMTECMKGCKNPLKYLEDLRDSLYKKTKLKCSIGLAPNKFLAKMASDIKKPLGVTIIRKKDIPTILWPLPIKDMFGVGKKTYPRLEALGIKTIGDLAKCEDNEVKKVLGKGFTVLKGWANGVGDDNVSTEEMDPKSIGHSSTFLFDTDDYEEIKKRLYELSNEVAQDAKKKEKVGTTVSIVMKTPDFITTNRSITLNFPTNEGELIYNNAMKLFDANYKGNPIRLIGVTLSNLKEKEEFLVRMNLFDLDKVREENATKLLINELNAKFKNKKTFIKASELEIKHEKR